METNFRYYLLANKNFMVCLSIFECFLITKSDTSSGGAKCVNKFEEHDINGTINKLENINHQNIISFSKSYWYNVNCQREINCESKSTHLLRTLVIVTKKTYN